MATTGDDLTYEDRMIAAQRAIWRELKSTRVAVQWLLAIQLVFITLGVAGALLSTASFD